MMGGDFSQEAICIKKFTPKQQDFKACSERMKMGKKLAPFSTSRPLLAYVTSFTSFFSLHMNEFSKIWTHHQESFRPTSITEIDSYKTHIFRILNFSYNKKENSETAPTISEMKFLPFNLDVRWCRKRCLS